MIAKFKYIFPKARTLFFLNNLSGLDPICTRIMILFK